MYVVVKHTKHSKHTPIFPKHTPICRIINQNHKPVFQNTHQNNKYKPKYVVYSKSDNVNITSLRLCSLQTFNGNVDRKSVRVNWFPTPVVARYIRVVAQSWTSSSAPCFRIDLYGCNNSKFVLLHRHFVRSNHLHRAKI